MRYKWMSNLLQTRTLSTCQEKSNWFSLLCVHIQLWTSNCLCVFLKILMLTHNTAVCGHKPLWTMHMYATHMCTHTPLWIPLYCPFHCPLSCEFRLPSAAFAARATAVNSIHLLHQPSLLGVCLLPLDWLFDWLLMPMYCIFSLEFLSVTLSPASSQPFETSFSLNLSLPLPLSIYFLFTLFYSFSGYSSTVTSVSLQIFSSCLHPIDSCAHARALTLRLST